MPEIVLKIIVCLVASFFAGIGTGFVGMSAAVAITPLLIGFLNIPHFEATAIALASDVLASAGAAIMYWRHKNVDFKNGALLLITVILFTLVGTVVGYYIPSNVMGQGTIITIFLMGCKMLFFPNARFIKEPNEISKKSKIIYSVGFGALIGFVCGFVGAGGGMMLLLCLTVFLGFETHKAVGTSVFVMTFSAFVGSAFHIIYQGVIAPTASANFTDIDFITMGLCVVFTLIFSLLGSKIANKLNTKNLNMISGIMLLLITVTVFLISNTKLTGIFLIMKIAIIMFNIVPFICYKYYKRDK